MTDTSAPVPPPAPGPGPAPGQGQGQAQGQGQGQGVPALRVINQYIKDMSFENPGNPVADSQPAIELKIDVGATPHAQGNAIFEVSLKLTADAKVEGVPLFLCELDYAGMFRLENIAPQDQEPMLLIECPRLLFPYGRRIISEITRDGGFPPLLIDPIDFVALYNSQRQGAAPPPAAPPGAEPMPVPPMQPDAARPAPAAPGAPQMPGQGQSAVPSAPQAPQPGTRPPEG